MKVPNTNAVILVGDIEKIKDGTFTNFWRAYKTDEMNVAGSDHFNVSHKCNFVNPLMGVHSQSVERL